MALLTLRLSAHKRNFVADFAETGLFLGRGWTAIDALDDLEGQLRMVMELTPLALLTVRAKKAELAKEE